MENFYVNQIQVFPVLNWAFYKALKQRYINKYLTDMLSVFSPWMTASYQCELNMKLGRGVCRGDTICVRNTHMRWDVQATLTHDHTACYSQIVPGSRIGIPEHYGQQTWIPQPSQIIDLGGNSTHLGVWGGNK